MSNPWDVLSPLFDTTKDESEISSIVADNILIAWPVLLDFIDRYCPFGENLRLLEYGCGSGSFAYKLFKQGFNVTGVDSSEKMIQKAKAAYGDEVNFLVGDSAILSTVTPFSIATSIMTFQFIENIEKVLQDIANVIKPEGIFTFAVHNPKLIKAYIDAGIFFEDFDSAENPKKGMLNVHGTRIPIFIRTSDEYNHILQKLGFELLLEDYPPFTEEFLEKYPIPEPKHVPEYLILGYKKTT